MGNYATRAQLEARYEDQREVAAMTLDEETGVPDPEVLDEVIDGSEGEINGYLGTRYLIPVDVVTIGDDGLTADLNSMTLDVATWRLETRVNKVSDARQTAYDRVIERLKEIAAGTVVIAATEKPPDTSSRGDVSRFGGPGTGSTSQRLMTRATQGKL